jgi:hypothetical protein
MTSRNEEHGVYRAPRDDGRRAERPLTCTDSCTYNSAVLEWDPAKARANLRKHGVAFADTAATI